MEDDHINLLSQKISYSVYDFILCEAFFERAFNCETVYSICEFSGFLSANALLINIWRTRVFFAPTIRVLFESTTKL